jgi:2',3'-cyclic-nucleotide 2'-phosphodiesterase (5'-nucleotidase family)
MPKRTFTLFFFPVLFILLVGCNRARGPKEITILHTNDTHGAFLPDRATWIKTTPPPQVGGFLALNSHIQTLRAANKNTLLLDAGDLMTGNMLCNIEFKGAKGGALVHFMNKMGYEGMTIGNHEFDLSQQNLKNLIKLAEFPVISANLFQTNGELFAPAAWHIYRKDDLRVGVIGVITEELFSVLNADRREGLEVKSSATTVEKIIDQIDSKTDLIIVLSHSGFKEDSVLATKLSRRVDVIVGGHSHTRLKKPVKVNGILIVQAGAKATNLGELNLTVAGDTVQNYAGQLIDVWVEGITKDPELEQEIDFYRQQIDDQFGRVIGRLESNWVRDNHTASNIGNFLADCMREGARTDFGCINSGGIRKNMEPGEITVRDIKEILPFENYVCTFSVTGAELLKIMEKNAEKIAHELGGILQVGGISYRWKGSKNSPITILDAKINGQPVDPTARYTGATMDFVVISNAQEYFGFVPAEVKQTPVLFSDMVIELVTAKKVIVSEIDGRIQPAE